MSADDIINEWVHDAHEQISLQVHTIVGKLEKGERTYLRDSTTAYADMLLDIKDIHGKKEADKTKSLIED